MFWQIFETTEGIYKHAQLKPLQKCLTVEPFDHLIMFLWP